MTLNYKYRLMPTEAQARALDESMRVIRWGWNLAVRRTRYARRMRRLGRGGQLHKELAAQSAERNLTGRRANKINGMVTDGKTRDQAIAETTAADVARAWKHTGSGLDVAYAMASTDAAKKAMLGGRLGSAWAKLISGKGKFLVAWKACWQGTREAPRKNKDYTSGWLAAQIQDRNPIQYSDADTHGDNWVSLRILMPGLARTAANVRFLHHRQLPAESKIVEIKVIRKRQTWYVVFTIDANVCKDYPATGLSCGIDPGQNTPVTLVGEEMRPGIDGIEMGPGRPLARSLKRLRRLQRKLDRQRRANNPECYDATGRWIKGKRLSRISQGMRETEDLIARTHARCSDIRSDVWSKEVDRILNVYDTVYLGNWTDGSPTAKKRAKRERKKAFAATGVKRPKGQAARERTRSRIARDNALGVFRRRLLEKAARSTTPKKIIITSERNTTRMCCTCGALTGPTGVGGLSVRIWTCSECGNQQYRDRASGWNILQFGKRQAGGQPVTGGHVIPTVAATIRPYQGSGSGILRTVASGHVGVSTRVALERVYPPVLHGDSGTVSVQGPGKSPLGPQPLAIGSLSPIKINHRGGLAVAVTDKSDGSCHVSEAGFLLCAEGVVAVTDKSDGSCHYAVDVSDKTVVTVAVTDKSDGSCHVGLPLKICHGCSVAVTDKSDGSCHLGTGHGALHCVSCPRDQEGIN